MADRQQGSVWDRALARAGQVKPLRVLAFVLMAPFVLIGLLVAVVWFVCVQAVVAGVAEGWATARDRLNGGDDVSS